MRTNTEDVKAALTLLLAAILEIVLCSFFVTLFWNLTIPTIIPALSSITYFQGMGLYMLFKFLTYRDSK